MTLKITQDTFRDVTNREGLTNLSTRIMKKIVRSLLQFCASLNLTIIVLSVFALLFTLQVAGNKLVALPTFKSWEWLKVLVAVDIYHSGLFLFLLVLFSLNLVACCINRIPRTLAFLRKSPGEPHDPDIDCLPVVKKFTTTEGAASRKHVTALLSSQFRTIKTIDRENNQSWLFAEKGKFSHIGFYFAHVSILAIIIGVMLSTRGYECSVEMRKGELLDPLVARDSSGKDKTFDFSIQCEDFATSYYKGTSEIMKHQSTLTLLKDGKKVTTQLVDFSHPLLYSGISIYQDRFTRKIKYAKIKVVSRAGEDQFHVVKRGDRFEIDRTGMVISISKIKSTATSLQVSTSGGRPAKLLVSKTPVSFPDERLKDYQLSLVETFEQDATSLLIINDPGEGVIWYSFLAMVLGFSIAFFFFHQKVWVQVEEHGSARTITLAGTANKNLKTVEQFFQTIQNELKGVSTL
jgi:cytochrome c biogenesis protein